MEVKTCGFSKQLHKLGGPFVFCLHVISYERRDKMIMLWEWISGTRAVGKKLEKLDQAVAFIPRVDQMGDTGRKKKVTK